MARTVPFMLAAALATAELLVSCSAGKVKNPFADGAAIVAMPPIPNPPEPTMPSSPPGSASLPVPPIPPANLIDEYTAANISALAYAARATPDNGKLLRLSNLATQARQALLAFQKDPSDERLAQNAQQLVAKFKAEAQ